VAQVALDPELVRIGDTLRGKEIVAAADGQIVV